MPAATSTATQRPGRGAEVLVLSNSGAQRQQQRLALHHPGAGFHRGEFLLLGANLNQTVVSISQWYFLKQAGQLERANKGLAEDQEDASELEAIRRFYVLLTAQDSLSVLEQTAKKSKELWDRAEALYEAGKGIKGDALAAHVNYGTDLNNAIQQHIVVVQAQADLASWLGRPETDDLKPWSPRASGPSRSRHRATARPKPWHSISERFSGLTPPR